MKETSLELSHIDEHEWLRKALLAQAKHINELEKKIDAIKIVDYSPQLQVIDKKLEKKIEKLPIYTINTKRMSLETIQLSNVFVTEGENWITELKSEWVSLAFVKYDWLENHTSYELPKFDLLQIQWETTLDLDIRDWNATANVEIILYPIGISDVCLHKKWDDIPQVEREEMDKWG